MKLTCDECKKEYEGYNFRYSEHEEQVSYGPAPEDWPEYYLAEIDGNDFCSEECMAKHFMAKYFDAAKVAEREDCPT